MEIILHSLVKLGEVQKRRQMVIYQFYFHNLARLILTKPPCLEDSAVLYTNAAYILIQNIHWVTDGWNDLQQNTQCFIQISLFVWCFMYTESFMLSFKLLWLTDGLCWQDSGNGFTKALFALLEYGWMSIISVVTFSYLHSCSLWDRGKMKSQIRRGLTVRQLHGHGLGVPTNPTLREVLMVEAKDCQEIDKGIQESEYAYLLELDADDHLEAAS